VHRGALGAGEPVQDDSRIVPSLPELAPRVRPVQQRAKQTVDLILDTAAILLEEVGVDAFNTNLLAERAGVAVRSVYRYYPNKLAVVVALYERHLAAWEPHFDDTLRDLADPSENPLDAWDAMIDRYVKFLEMDAGRAIRRSVQALPELSDIDRLDNDRGAKQVAVALQARGVEADGDHLEAIGHVLINSCVAVIDEALSSSGRASAGAVEVLKRMHRSYLSWFLD
jgi:AcrR family transcriptional regulator